MLIGISRGFSAVNIRKFILRAARLEGLVELAPRPRQAAAFLEASVPGGLNILVAGGTQAGKTTMLNCRPRRSRAASVWCPQRKSSSCRSRDPTRVSAMGTAVRACVASLAWCHDVLPAARVPRPAARAGR